jgi:hypothetical protein
MSDVSPTTRQCTKREIEQLVISQISQITFVEKSEITLASRIDEDLSIDEKLFNELCEALENECEQLSLSFTLTASTASECEVVGDLVDLMWMEVIAIVGEQEEKK